MPDARRCSHPLQPQPSSYWPAEANPTSPARSDESRIARVNRKQPHLDAVLIGVVALLAASFLLPIIKSLNNENIDSLSAGTLGGAIGLAVGYGIGRIRK